ncbi:TonB-dependent receptor plug domain-containing protein [Novosphingobium sp. JCM 18896]|uniref:TonB-dependent receptor plug domain-containing protein n=1 Tax=Novosphingobium sp. JCM 18896 TaxID=2989731 RepID=UPI0022233B9E|nr:TonB-dependent receptor [Novosphingobium sp. JCM 18896]MCW1429540.1 TonB-dependent receptor [Novosphingobium sp. JCM 18896]
MAQTAPSEEAENATVDDIVVTGTLLRGVAPAGTNIIGVTQADVQSTGATTTSQLLQTIPQLGAFNSLQAPAGAGNTGTVNRPNLRNLPGNTTAGGSTTLVMMDGHRIVGMGVSSTTPDPDVIPPGALERVEIVPDGGSAVYGADAVAGVINFITRKKFDGVLVDGHYGFADNYHQLDTNVTIGRDWGSGGLYVSYNYAEHSAILGRDRDYVQQFAGTDGRTNLLCSPGNVRVGTTLYGLPFTTPPVPAATPRQCDLSDLAAVYPSERRHSVFAGFNQQLNDAINVDIKAFYTNRKTEIALGEYLPQNGVTVTSTNPLFAAHRIGTETSQTVLFSFGGADATTQRVSLSTWGITPTVTADLGGTWQLRVLGNYGQSITNSRKGAFNSTALTNAVNAALFNPYDVAASNAAATAAISNYWTYGRARQELYNARAVIDGDLFILPGGSVKLAVGGEYIGESWDSRGGDAVPGFELTGTPAQLVNGTVIAPATAGLRRVNLSRNVKAAFGEIVVPIFGTENATPFFEELTLSAAARYDDYSDVGHTFNPKIGVTWKPTDWLKLRGAWGKSFNAPSLADSAGADITTLFVLPVAGFGPPAGIGYPVPGAAQSVYVVRGNAPGIQPQKARTISVGADIDPPFVPGLKLGITYWKIKLKGVIGIPPGQSALLVYRDYPNVVTLNPTSAALSEVAASAQSLPFGPACHTNATPCSVYAIVDIRKNNLGDFNLDGLDFDLNYRHETGFGAISLVANANYELNREQKASPSLPFTDLLAANASRFRIRTTAGAEIGNLLAQVTWNHSAGYRVDPATPSFVPQTKVSAYDVFNLYFRYDVKSENLFKDLSFSLNVDNVFDTDPPEYRGVCTFTPGACGFINGNTLGRLVQFGASKKF